MDSTLKKLQVEIEMLEIKKSIFDAEKKNSSIPKWIIINYKNKNKNHKKCPLYRINKPIREKKK